MQAINRYKLLSASGKSLQVSVYDLIPYQNSFAAMAEFALNRDDDCDDQIWFLQHPPVYTQGTACRQETLDRSDIPVVKSDRGGQITYHGPGQLIMYPLLKLKRYGIGVKSLVASLEQSVINVLSDYQIDSQRREDAPGVYIDLANISALGLRIKKGTSYHGLSLNIDMDLTPFSNIDPCGYQGLEVTQLANYSKKINFATIQKQLAEEFVGLI